MIINIKIIKLNNTYLNNKMNINRDQILIYINKLKIIINIMIIHIKYKIKILNINFQLINNKKLK